MLATCQQQREPVDLEIPSEFIDAIQSYIQSFEEKQMGKMSKVK